MPSGEPNDTPESPPAPEPADGLPIRALNGLMVLLYKSLGTGDFLIIVAGIVFLSSFWMVPENDRGDVLITTTNHLVLPGWLLVIAVIVISRTAFNVNRDNDKVERHNLIETRRKALEHAEQQEFKLSEKKEP